MQAQLVTKDPQGCAFSHSEQFEGWRSQTCGGSSLHRGEKKIRLLSLFRDDINELVVFFCLSFLLFFPQQKFPLKILLHELLLTYHLLQIP